MMIRSGFALLILSVAGALHSHAQATHASAHAGGDTEAGQSTFQHYCVMCHSVTQGVKIVGPSLYSEMRGPHAKSATAVREVIVHGKGQMPALGAQLTEKDIADVLAYVRKQ